MLGYWKLTIDTYQKENEILRNEIKEKDAEIKRLKDKYEPEATTGKELIQHYHRLVMESTNLNDMIEYEARLRTITHIVNTLESYPKLEFTDYSGMEKEIRERWVQYIYDNMEKHPDLKYIFNMLMEVRNYEFKQYFSLRQSIR